MVEKKVLSEHIIREVQQSIAQASMCWESPEKAGYFKAEMAKQIADRLIFLIAEEVE